MEVASFLLMVDILRRERSVWMLARMRQRRLSAAFTVFVGAFRVALADRLRDEQGSEADSDSDGPPPLVSSSDDESVEADNDSDDDDSSSDDDIVAMVQRAQVVLARQRRQEARRWRDLPIIYEEPEPHHPTIYHLDLITGRLLPAEGMTWNDIEELD